MHKKMINEATLEQLKDFSTEVLDELKILDYDLYNKYEMYLYKSIYGSHFNKCFLEKALEKMHNEDGTTGGHWSLDQTSSVARQYGVEMKNFNEYDWNYVMNMIYSDYYGAVPNELGIYVKMAKKFIDDKDAPEGKAFKYYMSM